MFVMYVTQMKRKGTYLEIGGADGFTHSNTIALRDALDWSGALVEPDPDMFDELDWARGKSDKVFHAAIATDGHPGNAKFRRVGQLSSLVGHEGHDTHYQKRMDCCDTVSVKTVALADIMNELGRFQTVSEYLETG